MSWHSLFNAVIHYTIVHIFHVCLFLFDSLQVVHGALIHDEPHHIIHKRSIEHPIRILLYYDDSVYR